MIKDKSYSFGLILLGVGIGFMLAQLSGRREQIASNSRAGDAIQKVVLALESYRISMGSYPDTLDALSTSTEYGISSPLPFAVVYRRSADGFIVFTGAPDAVYSEQGGHVIFSQFENQE